jgi:hypothetical protein
MSEVPAANNVIFIGNSVSLGRGPANIPLFYPSYNNSAANIIYAANTLPGSPRNFTTTSSAYNWAVTNNFFINNSDNPIPRIDADGMVLYLDASQASSYPQTGSTWYDVSGNNINGTLTNGPTFNSNGAIVFDGVDDYVNCNNNSNPLLNPGPSEAWSLSTTFKNSQPLPNDNTIYGIAGKRVINEVNGYTLMLRGGNYNGVLARLSTSGQSLVDIVPITNYSNILSNGNYHQMVMTYGTNDTGSLYIDGVLVGQSIAPNFDFNNASSAFKIGVGDTNNGHPFNGSINSVSFYNKALTQTEIKQNYFQSNIVTDGLVFMTDANNLVSYPKSGTTSYSLTGSYVGNLINGVSFANNNGGVFSLDGSDDYIQIPYDSYWNSNVFGTATNFTLACWVKPDLFENWDTLISKIDINNVGGWYSANEGPAIWSYDGGFQGVFTSGVAGNPAGSYMILSYPTTNTTKWYHLCLTGDGTTLRFYVDGVEVANDLLSNRTYPVTTSTVGPTFGYRQYWKGQMANMSLYTRGITSFEVQQNYQATKDKFLGQNIVTNGLVLNLDAADKNSYPGTGTTWYDLSGNGNNATLYNGTSWNSTGYMSTDAVDDYIQIPNASSLQVTTGFTQVIWVKFNNIVTVSYKTLFGKPNLAQYGMIVEWYGGNPILFDFSVSGNRNALGLVYPGTSWVMVAQSYNSTGGANNQIGYIRGGATDTIYATRTGNVDTDTSPMNIGQAGLSMDVGMALVYNRGLTQTELDQIYNATKTRFGL